MKKLVGVLAIQGDFQAHIAVLNKLKVDSREIRNKRDLENVSHLVIPGGESTTVSKITRANGFWDMLAGFEGPVMGTCMGSVLMASRIVDPDADGWGMLDMEIRRNAYGRQISSFTAAGRIEISEEPFEMVFIRAPKIIKIGKNVKPIAWLGDEITGVMAGNKIALTFHPELSESETLHEYFISLPGGPD